MKDLLLLHGALGAASQFDRLAEILAPDFRIHRFNFEGHGGRETSQTYAIELFSQNLIDYIEEHQLESPLVFGYSMGGYVALYAASQGTQLGQLLTLGTKFGWTPEVAAKEIRFLDPDAVEEKVPKFALHLDALHSPLSWKKVMQDTAHMMTGLGQSPRLTDDLLKTITLKTRCCLGAEDKMVTREETEHVVSRLPNAEFMVLENTEHPIEKVDPEMLAGEIRRYFLP